MKKLIIALPALLFFSVLGWGNFQHTAASFAVPTRTPTATPRTSRCPEGATAKCKDGTCSYSKSRQGTCSWHGGVAEWY